MIISNISYINPDKENIIKCDISISDGKIEAFAEPGSLKPGPEEEIINAEGLFGAPGFCDIHSHFRDPGFTYKEDILSGAECAKRGGYTEIILMANTKPAVDNNDTLAYVLKKGLETGIHIDTCGSVTMDLKGNKLTDMKELKALGAVGFTDDGIPLMDEKLLEEAMTLCAELDVPISLHEEDKALISENGVNRGEASEHFGIGGAPREAEISLVERDIEIAKKTGVKLDIQHISAKETVELVRKARQAGYKNIYAEATPHHVSMTEKALFEFGTNAKMNPPVRTEEDRIAIIEGIKDGTISFIATDHAPHAAEEKQKPLTEAPSGITGLETAFSICYEYLVESGAITLPEMIRLFTTNPRRFYNMECPGISVNDPADIVIFDINEKWVFSDTVSKSFNSPLRDRTMHGKIKLTLCGGKTVYEDL